MQNIAEHNRFIDFFTLRGYRWYRKDASKELFKKDTLMPHIFDNIVSTLITVGMTLRWVKDRPILFTTFKRRKELMIKKIRIIKQVGVFSNFDSGSDKEFDKLTFIYGLNTYGKST